jgi:CheY-like chemotaxis protein
MILKPQVSSTQIWYIWAPQEARNGACPSFGSTGHAGLTASGIIAIEVASTDEALSYLESRSDICLVITEIDMPGCLSGLDLARFVMRRWPHIGIIVLGWPTQPTPSLPQAVTFLTTPCPPGALVEQVRATLAAFSRPT